MIKSGTLFKCSSGTFGNSSAAPSAGGGIVFIPEGDVVMFLDYHPARRDAKVLYKNHVCYVFLEQLKDAEID